MTNRLKVTKGDALSARRWNRLVDELPGQAFGNGAATLDSQRIVLDARLAEGAAASAGLPRRLHRIVGSDTLTDVARRDETLEHIVLYVNDDPGATIAEKRIQNLCVTVGNLRNTPGAIGGVCLAGVCLLDMNCHATDDVGKFWRLGYRQTADSGSVFLIAPEGLPTVNFEQFGLRMGRILHIVAEQGVQPRFQTAVVTFNNVADPGYYVVKGSATARSGKQAGVASGELQRIQQNIGNRTYEGTGQNVTANNWTECSFVDRYFQIAQDREGAWHFAGYDDCGAY